MCSDSSLDEDTKLSSKINRFWPIIIYGNLHNKHCNWYKLIEACCESWLNRTWTAIKSRAHRIRQWDEEDAAAHVIFHIHVCKFIWINTCLNILNEIKQYIWGFSYSRYALSKTFYKSVKMLSSVFSELRFYSQACIS